MGRLLATGTDSLGTYFLKKKPNLGPPYVGWNVTYRCNCFCTFCNTHDFANKKKELNTEEALRIVRELGKAKVVVLTLSGGEPLLRPDLPLIIREAKKYGCNVNLATNGALLEQKAESLIAAGIDSIGISLDSLIPEEHNQNRKHKGLYEKAEKAVSRIKKLRGKKRKYPSVSISCIVNKSNFKGIEEFVGYWKQYVDSVVLQPITTGTKSSLFDVSDDSLTFTEEDRYEFELTFKRVREKYPELNTDYEKEFVNFFFDRREMYKKYKCAAGFLMLQIDAFGDVFPCTENIWKIGSLREERFMEILRGHTAHKLRDYIRDGKNNCFCWYRCTGPFNVALNKLVRGRKTGVTKF